MLLVENMSNTLIFLFVCFGEVSKRSGPAILMHIH